MKKLMIAALAAGSMIALASPAAAQNMVSGNVQVTGNVNARCSVVPPGADGNQAFSGTIALGDLDGTDGTLRTDLEGSTSASPAGSVISTRVVCTAAQNRITVSAGKLSNLALADTNYSNDIDYTAELQVNTASDGIQSARFNTLAPVMGDADRTIGRVAAGAANNVTVRAYGFAAENGGDSLLVAGSYTSTINVTIAPVS